jgi:hypothetical protein
MASVGGTLAGNDRDECGIDALGLNSTDGGPLSELRNYALAQECAKLRMMK